MLTDRRELYRASNGDAWFLGRDPSDARAVVIHEASRPSGGKVDVIDLNIFLNAANGPEQQALLRLIGTLVDVPPYADRRGS